MKKIIIGAAENVLIVNKGKKIVLKARIDTGAIRSSVCDTIIKEIGALPIVGSKVYRSALSSGQVRPMVKLSFYLAGQKIQTTASMVERKRLEYQMIVGREDLKGRFLVDASKKYTSKPKG